MPEPDNKTKKVTVNTTKLRNLGTQFGRWGTDLDKLSWKTGNIKLTPGSTGFGVLVKKRFGDRIKNLGDNLTGLSSAFKQIGLQLGKIADVYDETENINTDDLLRLDQLMDTTEKYLPGIKNVIPQDLPDLPTGPGTDDDNDK